MVKINIGIVGEADAGKSCILNRFVDKQFDYRHHNKRCEKMYASNGANYELVINDIVSEFTNLERAEQFYPNLEVIILCFDLSNKCTYETIKRVWCKEFDRNAKHCHIILVGTKSDLPHQISHKKIKKIRNRLNAYKYVETSAMNNHNINDIFTYCIETYRLGQKPKRLARTRRMRFKYLRCCITTPGKNRLFINE